jgi:hypothetical protein
MTTTTPAPLDTERFPKVAAFLEAYTAGPGDLGRSDVADLAGTVERVVQNDEPFPVATIDDFLPRDLYHQVLRDFDTLSFTPPTIPGAGYVGSRKASKLQDWKPGIGEGDTLWDDIARAARAPRFVRALFTHFASVVEQNLSDPRVADASNPGFVLYANLDQGRDADEALGAHVDALHKLLTIVLYLDLSGPTTAESYRLWGTAVYHDDGTRNTVEFSPNASHQPAGHVRFRPNRAFVMPNTARSLHGVAGGEDGVTRRSLMWGYWMFSPQR